MAAQPATHVGETGIPARGSKHRQAAARRMYRLVEGRLNFAQPRLQLPHASASAASAIHRSPKWESWFSSVRRLLPILRVASAPAASMARGSTHQLTAESWLRLRDGSEVCRIGVMRSCRSIVGHEASMAWAWSAAVANSRYPLRQSARGRVPLRLGCWLAPERRCEKPVAAARTWWMR